ncbi:MAG TPA: hypothetical protein DDY32_09740 [Desulfobulbaceae bacterium]|nr:hypothetical protein [Desulfobulbaceae bacterium]
MWLLLFVFFDKTAADWCDFAPFRIGVVCETIVLPSWGGPHIQPVIEKLRPAFLPAAMMVIFMAWQMKPEQHRKERSMLPPRVSGSG